MFFTRPVSYHQATKLFPKAFNADRVYELATPKQLAFLKDVGFTNDGLWTKEAASFALSSFKMLRNTAVYDLGKSMTDAKMRKLVYKAFRNERITRILFSLDGEYIRSGERHTTLARWIDKNC